jgi:anti-sigma factor RsiW
MNCKSCQSVLPDLLMEPSAPTSVAARAHIATCAACAKELAELEATFALLDAWEAPEISPYFDQKLSVRLREEQAAPPAGWFERLRDRLQFNTGRQFRPALTGALAAVLILGGGSVGITTLLNQQPAPASATVKDLQILENNSQAMQQVDKILQENATEEPGQAVPPQS